MPRGEPSKNTIRSERYQKKAGYKAKSYKFKGDVAERFADACKAAGVSQSSQLTKMMEEFIAEHGKE